MGNETSSALLRTIVEPRRRANGLSVRRAAARAGMSEASWRQLTRGGVSVKGVWTPRTARRGRLLTMAAAVDEDTLDALAEAISATSEERQAARATVYLPDPAEEEILGSRHLTPEEKLHLVSALRQLRRGDADADEPDAGAGREQAG